MIMVLNIMYKKTSVISCCIYIHIIMSSFNALKSAYIRINVSNYRGGPCGMSQ